MVVWGVRGSCCGTLRKLCLTKQARFSQTAATRSGRFICHRQRSHRSPYERSSGALLYFLARKKVHCTYSKPCFNAKKTPPHSWWGLCSRYLSPRGSEPTADSGGKKEVSEWQRSVSDADVRAKERTGHRNRSVSRQVMWLQMSLTSVFELVVSPTAAGGG